MILIVLHRLIRNTGQIKEAMTATMTEPGTHLMELLCGLTALVPMETVLGIAVMCTRVLMPKECVKRKEKETTDHLVNGSVKEKLRDAPTMIEDPPLQVLTLWMKNHNVLVIGQNMSAHLEKNITTTAS